jgi:hypothetical protein
MPYVTGHRYKVHWRYGIDFTKMIISVSEKWVPADKNLLLVHNFTDVRARVDFISGGETALNMTLVNKTNANLQTGDNIVYNDTATRELHWVINGKNSTKSTLTIQGYRCDGPCLSETNDTVIEDTVRRWSVAESWPSGKVPVAGEDVEILPGINMLYDVEESPIINLLMINGRLTFEDSVKDLHLKAKYIFVKTGELIIGNETNPFTKNAKITLYGEKAFQHITLSNAIEAGNKMIMNTGMISMYGVTRNQMSRMTKEAYFADTVIHVEPGLDWQSGEMIGIAPSTTRFNDSDTAKIVTYNGLTGELVLDRALSAYHFGAATSTATKYYGVDIRNEVYLLNRNIKIAGEDIEAWGC